MKNVEMKIEKARETIEELAGKYNVDTSKIVWMGNNKFIIVKDGQELRINLDNV